MASVTPKLHMLEDHMVTWMKQWHVTPGLHSEQGLESLHSVFNHLERTHAPIRNTGERMKKMMKEHLLQNCSEVQTRVPTAKRRKQGSED